MALEIQVADAGQAAAGCDAGFDAQALQQATHVLATPRCPERPWHGGSHPASDGTVEDGDANCSAKRDIGDGHAVGVVEVPGQWRATGTTPAQASSMQGDAGRIADCRWCRQNFSTWPRSARMRATSATLCPARRRLRKGAADDRAGNSQRTLMSRPWRPETTSSKPSRLSAMEQLMFFWLKRPQAAPNTPPSVAPASTAASKPLRLG